MGSGVTLLGQELSLSRNDAAQMGLGFVVQRATMPLPATTTEALFTVTGRCVVTHIVGEVTTVIQTQACNLKLQGNPTAAGSSVDLCANLNISADVVGSLYVITGTFADALADGLAVKAQLAPFIVQAGTIDLVTSATNTGSVKWTLRYYPLDEDALIVAA